MYGDVEVRIPQRTQHRLDILGGHNKDAAHRRQFVAAGERNQVISPIEPPTYITCIVLYRELHPVRQVLPPPAVARCSPKATKPSRLIDAHVNLPDNLRWREYGPFQLSKGILA